MELGTCFVREDGRVFVLLKDGVRKIDGALEGTIEIELKRDVESS